MLSTSNRLKLEEIANRIRNREEVSWGDMEWATKWAKNNRSASAILSRARRISIQGEAHPDSMDGFLQALDLGQSDPSSHLSGPQNPVSLAEWARPNDNDHMTRD